jgi:hypothetical protein
MPPGVETVFVPKDTPVVVALNDPLNSYAASSREPLDYTVTQDTVINGHIVAKAGDEATGMVLEAQSGNPGGLWGFGWKAADLRVDVEAVNNFCGDTLRLHFIRSEYRRRQGAFGSHADLEIIQGQKYIASVAHAQRVCGQITNETPLPIPEDALPPDSGLRAEPLIVATGTPEADSQSTPEPTQVSYALVAAAAQPAIVTNGKTMDASLLPDGTYAVRVVKVIDARHVLVVLNNGVKTKLAAGRATVDFSAVHVGDDLKLSTLKGAGLIYLDLSKRESKI